jgi:flagellar hook-associated protein FlgK
MANHLMQRANDEESPLLRAALQKKSEEIRAAADEFINAVNDLLQDPENAQAEQRVKDAAERLRQLMDDTTDQLKQAEAEVPSGMEAALPSMDAVKGAS